MSFWQDILAEVNKILQQNPAPPLTWQPTYEPQDYIVETFPDGSVQKIPVTIEYRVTAETAEHLRAIYDPNGTVILEPVLGAGGPFFSIPDARALKYTNGTLNCGSLATMFSHAYPLDPDHADRACKAIISSRGLV